MVINRHLKPNNAERVIKWAENKTENIMNNAILLPQSWKKNPKLFQFSFVTLVIIAQEFVNKLLNYVQSTKSKLWTLLLCCVQPLRLKANVKYKMNPQTTAPATSLRHYLLSSLAKEEDTKNLSAAWNACSSVWALFNCAIYQPKKAYTHINKHNAPAKEL